MTEDSFTRAARDHAKTVGRIAAAYARPGPDREDLVQEIFLQLWRTWRTFRGDASPRTFVLRVAHNVAFDHVRRRYRNREDLVEHEAPARPIDPTARLSIEEALRSLRISSRQVALLALEGLTTGEIAEVLGISEGNAAVRLSRARAELKTRMEEEST